jgi:L-iditol 2-dehydrogenase
MCGEKVGACQPRLFRVPVSVPSVALILRLNQAFVPCRKDSSEFNLEASEMTTEKAPELSQDGKQQIRASVLHGAKDLRIVSITISLFREQYAHKAQENRFLFPPGPTELQVSVRSTGLCGSDLHYYRHYRNGDIIVREPMSLGHESAGVVVAVGSDVKNFKAGDKVALEVGQPCEKCERCKEGRYNICKEMKFRSSAKAFPHAQGTLQDRINHPAAWCHK